MSRAPKAALALLLPLLCACPPPPDAPATPGSDPAPSQPGAQGTLIWGRGQDSKTLDPADATDGESVKPIENMFEGLVRYKEGSTEVEPWLATSWTVSDDRKTWTFTLREGVKFHDGTPLDAEAVVFSFERQRDPKHEFHDGEFVYWTDQFSFVSRVEAPDPRTVVFHLEIPFVPFLRNLAMFTASIVSPAQFRKLKAAGQEGETFQNHPVGTGPYRFKEWRRGEAIVLEANPDYWGGKPALEQVVFREIPDNNVRLSLLEKGDLHGIDGANSQDLAALRAQGAEAKVQVVSEPGMNLAYLAFNTRKKPFDDPRVRLACALALDLPQVAEKLFYGLAIPAANPMPPMLLGYDEALKPRAPDLERAKALLVEAGQAEGFTTSLWTMTNPRPYLPQPDKLAQYVKSALARLGIKVTIVPKEWSSYLEEIQNAEHDMCFMGWIGDNGDPDNFLYVLLDKNSTEIGKASNYSFYADEEVHGWLEQARVEVDEAKRAALYRQVQEKVYQDVPMLPLVHNTHSVVLSPRVKGFRLHPTGALRFSRVTLE